MVQCPPLCSDAITVLNSLSPFDQTAESGGPSFASDSASTTNASTAAATGVAAAWPPLGCLPLFLATSPDYAEAVSRTIQAANQVYAEFLKVCARPLVIQFSRFRSFGMFPVV